MRSAGIMYSPNDYRETDIHTKNIVIDNAVENILGVISDM